jgi:hypothetical protein
MLHQVKDCVALQWCTAGVVSANQVFNPGFVIRYVSLSGGQSII